MCSTHRRQFNKSATIKAGIIYCTIILHTAKYKTFLININTYMQYLYGYDVQSTKLVLMFCIYRVTDLHSYNQVDAFLFNCLLLVTFYRIKKTYF